MLIGPDQCGSVGWVSSHKVKGHWFSFWSGHMLRLRVLSVDGRVQEGMCTTGNQSMFLSHSLPSSVSKSKYNL